MVETAWQSMDIALKSILYRDYLVIISLTLQSWVQTTGQNKKNEKECTFASVIQVGTCHLAYA